MAGSLSKNDSNITLEIRTKSVEQTLIPLVSQITTLVNHKDKTKVSEKSQRALVKVGQLVNIAVERFVVVGESIADENVEIRDDMLDACLEAKMAGKYENSVQIKICVYLISISDKSAMIRSARQLLSAITKVLLLADRIVVKQLLQAKDKVLQSLLVVESVNSFTEFVKSFSQFGTDMVQLAHLSGDRQNDLKSEKHRAQMGSARAILEKSTMMLLTASKTCLRHPDCQAARRNRDGVFIQMKRALDLLQHIVTDGTGFFMNGNSSPTANGDSGIALNTSQPTASRAFKDFEDQVELTRITLIGPATEEKLQAGIDAVVEGVQDFTDSPYTSHDNREKIVTLTDSLRNQLKALLKTGHNMVRIFYKLNFYSAVSGISQQNFRKEMYKCIKLISMEQASDLFKMNEDHELLRGLQRAGINGEVEYVDELTIKFDEHQEQIEEVCKLFRHMATTEPLVITAEHNDTFIHSIGPLTLYSAQTLAQYPNSKIARENLDVFADAWESQINDLSILVKEVNDVCLGKMDKLVYLSLPRPGEQAKIAKLGLEMKLITSEMDAETDKWEEPDNEIVKRAKNMSSMAFSMYLFTRGEGALRTTQDLFVQAEFFAEEGNKLYKTVRDFSQRVPVCPVKEELLTYLERIPVCCQQILFNLKSSTFGKTPTFNKVDSTIQETKNLMNIIAKIVTTCFICATKVSTKLTKLYWNHTYKRNETRFE
ncbi:hypothetical protein LOTGIDRAFT_141992 [Lottia gigantea]|uniref:Alpha-catulin n=1 Tax=Lottia gigantea TaxID=225164 RepID=V4AVU9_LOTGI|nr:hypothetical protein LOTGIDRAFT_141992 [Lottia gigantea]ESO99195.1 hypothetical protein LOTGIDRAFT_141992 [Lottia gigantea]